jgi:hypothetical protein
VAPLGNASLAGGLIVNRDPLFDPPNDLNAQILSATTRTGQFDVAYFAPALSGDRFFRLIYPRDGSV